ncbi:hypothetical protein [Acinetobacter sp. HY1485]|uniref:hypothetical protein n=1 Tax=Acinetobacter sp. HY1485 TaxID=2970918 RepID=UPI0022B9C681|nr:hypothetical protein [Acinetobacter sp. HY1485]
MDIIRSKNFTGKKAWDGLDIATIEGASVRLHWTDQPYIWHINDGSEVFVVIDGCVKMYYKENNAVKNTILYEGDIFYANTGIEHVAHPKGVARILVIEKADSI